MRMVDGVPAAGTILDEKYLVGRVFARGGMGCLVNAEHLLLRKQVAIKFASRGDTAMARARLVREARAAQSLACEHVVRVFDLGMHEGTPFIVMELLDGRDLHATVKARGPLPVELAVDCVLEACVAIAEAHSLGIVHRDVKPGNLFAVRAGTRELVKVLDFGISKLADAAAEAVDARIGTPHYAAPEQLRRAESVDARADVWSLAVTLFYLVSAEHPFEGASAEELVTAIFTDPPRRLDRVREGVPAALADVVEAALARRAEDRTPSVEAFARALLPFATKRGARAAELVTGLHVAGARRAASPPETSLDGSSDGTWDRSQSETADRLPSRSRSLPGGPSSLESTEQPASVEVASGAGPRARVSLAALGGLVLLSAVLALAWPAQPPSRPPAPEAAAEGTPTGDVLTTSVSAASEPSMAVVAAPSGAQATAAPRALTSSSATRASAARVAPRAVERPSAAAMPRAVEAPTPRDIDGVPIID